ncbi:hypothetical protein BRADI_2g36390v3 [Brachypodium distachyon]|uniref:KIB1-4 beta-propeller domain-containing protein n=1 Tax=Brachypodium distachyon TaxID=15368 RepID=I1HM05_BRADI|nr:hypothetical protein BRADI_2g36390v3 [Brachypodium distachyon]
MDGGGSVVSPLPVLVHDLGTLSHDSSQTQYSISTQSLTTANIAELRDHRCLETPQGWILALHPASLETFLWRPQDGHRIELPPLKGEEFPEHCKCLLSDTPGAASGCSVVVFDLDESQMWACKIGERKWDSYSYSLTMFLAGGVPREKNIAKCQLTWRYGTRSALLLSHIANSLWWFQGMESLLLSGRIVG